MPRSRIATQKRNQKKVLRASSEEAIFRGLSFIKKLHLPNDSWIGTTNRYGKDCIAALKGDANNPSLKNDRHLGKYIAASTILHVADGWDILGRAMDSHIERNSDVARHLGYYAELRAAMSLLACEGVGIFSNSHFSLNKNFICDRIPRVDNQKPGTHEMTWVVIQHWSNLRRSTELLSKIIRVGGKSLHDWLAVFNYGDVWWQLHGSKWLKNWGLDLKHLADDRDARNTSSYRPTRLSTKTVLNQEVTSQFLVNFWQGMEPSPEAFEILDRHLLRITLEQGFKATSGDDPLGNDVFESQVERGLDGLGFSGSVKDELKKFILRQIDPDNHLLISEAKQDDDINAERHHIQVLSRAVLLLRLATGAVVMHLRKSGISSGDLKFWWEKLGEDRGEWDVANPPLVLSDLWADIEDAVQEIENWETNNISPRSFFDWRSQCRGALATLTTSERIIFWGLEL